MKWNGAKLIDVETMLGWAKKMTWKGLHPVVELRRHVYTKGIALGKVAMEAVEARLKRDPQSATSGKAGGLKKVEPLKAV